jgi:hypothetical protein
MDPVKPGASGSKRSVPVTVARTAAVLTACALLVLLVVALPYYTAPIARRVRDPWHPWLRPSGIVGQSLGLAALGLFLFLWLYPLRKRLARVKALGSLPRWLNVHIAAGLLVPFVAAMHAGWRFEGLIGLGYASMFVVCLSGFVGRYLYVHVPRSRSGVALTLEEVAVERRALLGDVASASGIPVFEIEKRLAPDRPKGPSLNPARVLLAMLRDDVSRRRAVRRLARDLRAVGNAALSRAAARDVVRLARREMALAQQAAMLDGVHELFRWWHAAHKPFAIMALLAVLLHVGVAVAMGQTWLR